MGATATILTKNEKSTLRRNAALTYLAILNLFRRGRVNRRHKMPYLDITITQTIVSRNGKVETSPKFIVDDAWQEFGTIRVRGAWENGDSQKKQTLKLYAYSAAGDEIFYNHHGHPFPFRLLLGCKAWWNLESLITVKED